MNLKQLCILLVLVVVLGGAGLALYRNQNASWKGGDAEMGKKLLADLPVNDVACISIRKGNNQLNLVRKDDLWRVRERQDYAANFSQIRDFLLKVQELKIVQSEKVLPSQLGPLHLVPQGQGTNAPVVVEFQAQNGKPIKTLLLGKPHLKKADRSSATEEDDAGFPDGRYVRTGDGDSIAVISDPLENIEPKADAWLSKDFIHIEKIKTVELDFPQATNSWKLTRTNETAEWKLADARAGEQLDASKAASVSYPLSSPSFADVLPGGGTDGTGTNQPKVARIETFDHFKYTVRVGPKTNEDYCVTLAIAADLPKERLAGKDEKAADAARLDKEFKDNQLKLEDKLKQEQGCQNWTYLVTSWSIDPLLKERAQLLVDKKDESKKAGDVAGTASGPDDKDGVQKESAVVPELTTGTNAVPATTP